MRFCRGQARVHGRRAKHATIKGHARVKKECMHKVFLKGSLKIRQNFTLSPFAPLKEVARFLRAEKSLPLGEGGGGGIGGIGAELPNSSSS